MIIICSSKNNDEKKKEKKNFRICLCWQMKSIRVINAKPILEIV